MQSDSSRKSPGKRALSNNQGSLMDQQNHKQPPETRIFNGVELAKTGPHIATFWLPPVCRPARFACRLVRQRPLSAIYG
jgi:hypothetical protein